MLQNKKKPLRAHNSTSSVLALKAGVKTKTVSGGRKKSPNFFATSSKSTRNSNIPKLTEGFNVKNEKFVTVTDNKLPPCTVPGTPMRRETYILKSNKVGNKENVERPQASSKLAKPKHISASHSKLRKRTVGFTGIQNVKLSDNFDCSLDLSDRNVQVSNKDLSVAQTPPSKYTMFENENRESVLLRRETFDSHPGHILERKRQVLKSPEKFTPKKKDRNFKDMLDSLCLTPTPTSTSKLKLENSVSSDETKYPSCDLSSTNDRRMTYNLRFESKLQSESLFYTEETLSNSELKNESILCTEEITYSARRVTRSVSTRASDSPEKFDDSLDDVFSEKSEIQNFDKKWNEWQRRNLTISEGSSSASSKNKSDSFLNSPLTAQETKSTGLTPKLKDLDFTEADLFSSEVPFNFSILPPHEDSRRCSTIMKKSDNVHFSPISTKVRKDLFSLDDLNISVEPVHCDDLSRLSSDTFVKSESSLPDVSFHHVDSSSKEHLRNHDLEISLLPEDNSAKNVIEAGLWVKPPQKASLASRGYGDYVRNLDTIGEESMEMHLRTFSQSTINDSGIRPFKLEKTETSGLYLEISPPKCQMGPFTSTVGHSGIQPIKLEKTETGGLYLEISPPKSQMDFCTSTDGQEKRVSGIKGWSKTSVRPIRKPLQLKSHRGKYIVILP